jgi:hypothetical protein
MSDDAYDDAFELVARRFESLAMLSFVEDELLGVSNAVGGDQDDNVENSDLLFLEEETGTFVPAEDASSLPAEEQMQSILFIPGDSQIIAPPSPCPSLDHNIMSPGIPNPSFAGEFVYSISMLWNLFER